MLATALLVAAVPATASAQYTNFQAPAQDQYGEPPGTNPPPENPGNGGESPGRGRGGVRGERADRTGASDEDATGGVGGVSDGAGGPPLRDAEGGSLPFTGLDLSLLVLLGLLLTAAGFGLRAVQRAGARRAAGS